MIRAHVLAAVGLYAVLAGCGQSDHSGSATLLTRGLSGEPSTLDPGSATDSFSLQVLGDLYEGLAVEAPDGSAVPGTASSWQVSPDGKEYTFTLRADAKWSNGSPVRAEDFVRAFQRVVDPKNASPVADDLRILSHAADIIAGTSPPSSLGIRASGERTLIIDLAQPAAYLPQLLTHASTYPIFSEGSARSHVAEQLVSNGAYQLTKWSPGSSIDLKKNDNYWDAGHVKVPKVSYQPISDDNAQLARYRSGQLDLSDTVPSNFASTLGPEKARELVSSPFLATAYYGMNLREGPLASNKNLRLALAMSIDRERLVESLGFGQKPAYGFLPPGTWNYAPQSFSWSHLANDERITTARSLYERAGYDRKHVLHLRLLYNSNPVIRQTAVLIASMWKETLGVETELTEEEYKVFLQSRRDSSRWDVARLGWVADFNDATNFLDTLRRSSTNNDEGYSNPAFDLLLDEATTPELSIRRSKLEEAERTMLEDCPIIPIYFFVSKRLVKPYVHGVNPTPLDKVPSKSLALDATR
jgi:oligopeptide transport system substrate-binding protein